MLLKGYYTLISNKLRKDKTVFKSDYTGYKFYVNRDNFYVADTGDIKYALDETDNVMILAPEGYINVNNPDPKAKEAFTDMLSYMDTREYTEKPLGV